MLRQICSQTGIHKSIHREEARKSPTGEMLFGLDKQDNIPHEVVQESHSEKGGYQQVSAPLGQELEHVINHINDGQ